MLRNGNITLLGEIRGLKPQRLTADPAAADLKPGLVWVNTTESALKWYDGAKVNRIASGDSLDNYLKLEGGTLTGPLVLSGNAEAALNPVPLQQLTTELAKKQDVITGAASTIDTENLAVNAILVSDADGKVAASAVSTATLAFLDGVTSDVQEQLDAKQAKLTFTPVNKAGDNMTGNLTFTGSAGITIEKAPANATDVVRLIDIDNLKADLDFQADVLAVQTDGTLTPTDEAGLPDSAVRYIVTDVDTLNAAFGTIAGLEDGDIIERSGDGFRVAYDVSAEGPGVLVWDRNTARFIKWNGTVWNEHGGLSGVTASAGLDKNGNTIFVKFGGGTKASADGAVTLNAGNGVALVDPTSGEASTAADAVLALRLQAVSGLESTADGLGIADKGISAAFLGDVVGNGLQGGAGSVIAVKAANSSIVVDASGVKLGDISASYLKLDSETASYVGQLAVPAPTADTSVTPKSYVDAVKAEAAAAATAANARIDGGVFVFDGTTGDSSDTYTITHNLGYKYAQVSVFDENDSLIMPDSIRLVDANSLQVTLAVPQKIRVVVTGKKVVAATGS